MKLPYLIQLKWYVLFV